MRYPLKAAAPLVALLLFGSCYGEPTTDAATAAEILHRAQLVYGEARGYRDRGEKRIEESRAWALFNKVLGRRKADTFTTQWDRGGRLELVYRGEWRLLENADGGVIVTNSRTGEVSRHESVDAALRWFAPLTGGASELVPPLLVDGRNTATILQLASAIRGEDQTVHDKLCYTIRGRDGRGREATVWIEQQRHVIRRVQQILPLKGDTTTRTIDYAEVSVAR